MSEIVFLDRIPVAQCPYCDGQKWFIHLDRMGNSVSTIAGFECAGDNCGFTITFKPINLDSAFKETDDGAGKTENSEI